MSIRAMTGLVAASLLVCGQTALADPGKHYGWKTERNGYDRERPEWDYARVVDVDPIYTQVRVSVPRQECWNETRYEEASYGHREPRATAGSMILGGILGAAIGNQIGSGDGRRAATVAGALIGTAIGHDAASRREARGSEYSGYETREARPYTVERCDTRYDDNTEQRIEAYRVTYVYHGRQYTTRLPYDPGDRVRVRVDVTPEVCDD